MTTYSRRKGSAWEKSLADFFTEHGTFGAGEVFRAPRWGALDQGDLVNTADFVVQAKAVKTIDLASFMEEVKVQKKNAGRRWGFAVVKRRNHGVERAYAVMELAELADLIRNYYRKEQPSQS